LIEFTNGVNVELIVKEEVNRRNREEKAGPARSEPKPGGALNFSFGVRRNGSSGPRRLFVPQEGLMSPAFEPIVERPHTILRANR
jgi:hypothetical protein